MELKIIDFEDAVPFGYFIKHADAYRTNSAYPDYQNENEFIIAEERHNNFFYHAIAHWLHCPTTTNCYFEDYMKFMFKDTRAQLFAPVPLATVDTTTTARMSDEEARSIPQKRPKV